MPYKIEISSLEGAGQQTSTLTKMFTVIDLRKFKNYDGVFGKVEKKRNKLLMTRDLVGEMPLYFLVSSKGKKIYVASTVGDLKKVEDFSFELVRAVPVTYTVKLSLKSGKYQNVPNYRLPHLKKLEDGRVVAKETIRRLNNAVKKRLPPPKERIALLLSGGTDSFSIGYFLKRYRRNLVAYTLTVDGKGRDLPNALRAAEFLKIPIRQVNVTGKQVVKAVRRVVELSELRRDYDVYMAVGSYFLAKRLKKDGINAVYTGDGANELFGDYHPWGNFKVSEEEITTQRFRRLMIFGRKLNDKYYEKQLGSGLGKSLSRLNKIFFHFGIKVVNPYLEKTVVEYLLSLPKPFLKKYPKQELFRSILNVSPELFPEKIRLQDGTGISDVLLRNGVDDRKLMTFFRGTIAS